MIPVRTLVIVPPSHGSLPAQTDAVFDLLAQRVAERGFDLTQVLSLTLFVDTSDSASYQALRDEVFVLARQTFAPETPPPLTVVAEPPEFGLVALEACVPASSSMSLAIVRKKSSGVPYTVVAWGDLRQIHAGGLSSHDGQDDPEVQAQEALGRMEEVLRREDLSFGHVVRQWNYIESMLADCPVGRRDRQRYQVFNDVRTLAYEASAFPNGYPAATGIGQAAGGVLLEFIAVAFAPEITVEALSNPRQVDAHRYSGDVLVGQPARAVEERTAPKFERAKRVTGREGELLFVSGTAAIVGEESVAPGDVVAQTKTTIDLMGAFLGGDVPCYVRAYVKKAADIPAVRRVCEAAYGPISATFVQADVCREELLVEMEAVRCRSVDD